MTITEIQWPFLIQAPYQHQLSLLLLVCVDSCGEYRQVVLSGPVYSLLVDTSNFIGLKSVDVEIL